MTRLRPTHLFAAAVLLTGCASESETEDTGPTYDCGSDRPVWGRGGEHMLPGTRCLDCHRAGGTAEASTMTVAGTVFAAPNCPDGIMGARVHLRDAEGVALILTTNEVGNFFTDDALTMPLSVLVEVDGQTWGMEGLSHTGSCALCHELDSPVGLVWGR